VQQHTNTISKQKYEELKKHVPEASKLNASTPHARKINLVLR